MDITLLHPSQIQPTKEGYDNLQDQIEFGRFNSVMSGAAPSLFEEFIVAEGQRTFTLTSSEFVKGDHSLQVYANGQLMRVGVDNDYIEVDNKTIEFNFDLFKDDVIVMRVNGGKSGPSLYEKVIATPLQTDFSLASSYSVGNNSLVVFINGAYQTLGIDYEEVDSKNVRMLEPLEDGDIVIFRVEGLPASETVHKAINTKRTYDANGLIIKEEAVGDGYHVIQEYFRDAHGRPETMTIADAGFTKIRKYIWVDDECVSIEETVVEVS